MASVPARINQDLFEAARAAGARMSRSTAQQLDHWARLGRELERSPGITLGAIERVLAGQAPYDGLTVPEQAIVRVEWDARHEQRIASLNFKEALESSGQRWSEADANGVVTVHDAAAKPDA